MNPRNLSRLCVVLLSCLFFKANATAQSSYITDVGYPNYGTEAPLPIGSIDVSNGNVHIPISFTSIGQRGKLSASVHLDYDSKIWQIVEANGSYSWQPVNVPQRSFNGTPLQGGWRFQMGDAGGTVQHNTTLINCYTTYNDFSFTDQTGTTHTFPFGTSKPFPSCSSDPAYSTNSGFATDSSGYQATVTNYTSLEVWDPMGNEVYPTVTDTLGNTMNLDSVSGDLYNTNGAIVAAFTTLTNNVQNLTVPAPIISSAAPIIITYTNISVHTNFGQSGVAEFAGSFLVPSTIQLADGTEYQFTYDSGTTAGHYGELTQIAIPTGGTIQYGYSNYFDSYNNENRWLTSALSNGGTTRYVPSIITTCTSNGSSTDTGCKEQVVVTTPAGDDTVYTMTLNQGAWNTSVARYTGSHSSGTLLLTTASQNTFTNYTTQPGCSNAGGVLGAPCQSTWRTSNITTTTLAATGQQVQQETDYVAPPAYQSPWYGVPQRVSTTDFYTGTTVPSPIQIKEYQYGNAFLGGAPFPAYYLGSASVFAGTGPAVTSSQFSYDSTPLHPSSQFPQTSVPAGHGGNLTVAMIDGEPWNMTYDYAGAMQTATDPKGNVTQFAYDPSDSLVTQTTRPSTNGVAHVSTATYNSLLYSLEKTNDENSVANGSTNPTTYTYYGGGQGYNTNKLQSISLPDGGLVSYSQIDANYSEVKVLQNSKTQASTITTTYTDAYGQLGTVYANGINTTYSYDTMGRLLCVTHPYSSSASSTDGSDCVTSRDGLNRPLILTHPDGSTIRYTYLGNKVTMADETGRQWVYVYDSLGRMTAVLENNGAWETDYTYNAVNQMTSAIQKGGSTNSLTWPTRTWSYDGADRLYKVTTPEAGTVCYGAISNGTCTGSIDANGNPMQRTDGNGFSTLTYDALNRLVTKVTTGGPSAITQTYSYDVAPTNAGFTASNGTDQLVAAFDSSGGGEYYQYDPMGRLTTQSTCFSSSSCSVNSNVVTANYDQASNLLAMGYPDGRVITSTYDTNNRLLQKQYSAWSGQALQTPVSYWSNPVYLPGGEVQSAQLGQNIQVAASYSNRKSLTGLAYASGSTNLWGKAYSWDLNEQNLLQTTDGMSGVQRQFTYDAVNRLLSAVDYSGAPIAASGSASITGTEHSHNICPPSQQSNSAPSSPQATLPPPKCILTPDSGTISLTVGTFTASASYGSGSTDANLAVALGQSLNGAGSPVSATVNGALISMSSKVKGQSGNYSLTGSSSADFSVSASGAQMTGGQSVPLTGGMNAAYSYDAFGNLSIGAPILQYSASNRISDSNHQYNSAGGLLSDSSHVYKYDALGRVTFGQNMSPSATYTYDANNLRLTKTDSAGKNNYISFDGVPVAVLNNTNWVDFITANGSFIAEAPGIQGAAPQYRLADHLGSLVVLTDQNGNPLGKNDYLPYGQKFSSTTNDTYQFMGIERNTDTETTSALNRDLLDFQGRWMVPDPLDASYVWTNPQSLNRYAYVGGQVMLATDPSGLSSNADDGGSGGAPTPILVTIATLGLDELFNVLFGGGSRPVFTGTTKPRPQDTPGTGNPNYDDPLNETIGLPKGTHLPNQSIADIFNFPATGCGFRVCGSSLYPEKDDGSGLGSPGEFAWNVLTLLPRSYWTAVQLAKPSNCRTINWIANSTTANSVGFVASAVSFIPKVATKVPYAGQAILAVQASAFVMSKTICKAGG